MHNCNVMHNPIVAATGGAEKIMRSNGIHAIRYNEDAQPTCAVEPEELVGVRVAMDSAACENVIKPEGLPSDA